MAAKLLDILFRTKAETKGAQRTKAAIKDVKRESKETGSQGSAAFGALGTKLGALAGTAGAVTLAIGALRRGLRELKESIGLLKVQELAEIDISSALANAGELTDEYREKLQQLAASHQDLTGVGDETWLKLFSQLTRFGMHSGNVDEVSDALLNLTAIMDGRAEPAAMLLQRALEGQFEMFARYGITLEKTGDQTKDLQNLFEMLADKAGGKLEARQNSLTVATERHKAAVGDLKEVLADVLGLDTMARNWHDNWTDAAQAMGEFATEAGDFFGTLEDKAHGVANALPEVTRTAEEVAGAIQKAADASADATKHLAALEQARLRQAEADIDLAVAEGKITPEEARRRKATGRRDFALEQVKRERDEFERRLREAEAAEQKALQRLREAPAAGKPRIETQITPTLDAAAKLRAQAPSVRGTLAAREAAAQSTAQAAVLRANQAEQRQQAEARVKELEAQKKDLEKQLKAASDPKSPGMQNLAREQAEAEAAQRRVEDFERTGAIPGQRRWSPKSRQYRQQQRGVEQARDREMEQVGEARHAVGQVRVNIAESLRVLVQELQTLKSQVSNVQV